MGIDIRPGVHAKMDQATMQALNEAMLLQLPQSLESVIWVRDRVAELLRIEADLIEASIDEQGRPVLKFLIDCGSLARKRGWRHDADHG